MKQKNTLAMLVLFTGFMFLLPTSGMSGSRQSQRQVTKPPATPQKEIKPGQIQKKVVEKYKIGIEKFELTNKCQLKLVLKNEGADFSADEHKKNTLKVGRNLLLSLSSVDPKGNLRKKGGTITYQQIQPLVKDTNIAVVVTLFNGTKTTKQKLLKPTCRMSPGNIQKSHKKTDKKITPSKRDKSLPAVKKLDALKIKNAYVKDNNIHIVLQHSGRGKLSIQDLTGTEVEIRHGTKAEVISLKNNRALLKQLVTFGKEVDFDTGIKVKKDGIITVRIKGLKGGLTIKKKIVVTNFTPLKKPIKITPSLKMPEKKYQVAESKDQIKKINISTAASKPGSDKMYDKSKFWDLYVDRIEVETWMPNWKFTYDKKHPHNAAIYVSADAICPACPMWVKVRAYIKAKTRPKSQITKADVAKWGSNKIVYRARLSLANTGGAGHGSGTPLKEAVLPGFTWGDVQFWPGEGKIFELYPLSIDYKVKSSELEPLLDYNGQLRVPVFLSFHMKDYTSEINTKNNFSHYPELLFCKQTFPIVIKSPDPKGGNNWVIGSTKIIKWIATGIKKRMKITLWNNENWPEPPTLIGVIADNIVPPPPNSGSSILTYSWHVGDLKGGKVEKPGTSYYIKIDCTSSSTGNTIQLPLIKQQNYIRLLKFTKKFK